MTAENDNKIRVQCPECQAHMKAAPKALEKDVTCPKCKQKVRMVRAAEKAALAGAHRAAPARADSGKKWIFVVVGGVLVALIAVGVWMFMGGDEASTSGTTDNNSGTQASEETISASDKESGTSLPQNASREDKKDSAELETVRAEFDKIAKREEARDADKHMRQAFDRLTGNKRPSSSDMKKVPLLIMANGKEAGQESTGIDASKGFNAIVTSEAGRDLGIIDMPVLFATIQCGIDNNIDFSPVQFLEKDESFETYLKQIEPDPKYALLISSEPGSPTSFGAAGGLQMNFAHLYAMDLSKPALHHHEHLLASASFEQKDVVDGKVPIHLLTEQSLPEFLANVNGRGIGHLQQAIHGISIADGIAKCGKRTGYIDLHPKTVKKEFGQTTHTQIVVPAGEYIIYLDAPDDVPDRRWELHGQSLVAELPPGVYSAYILDTKTKKKYRLNAMQMEKEKEYRLFAKEQTPNISAHTGRETENAVEKNAMTGNNEAAAVAPTKNSGSINNVWNLGDIHITATHGGQEIGDKYSENHQNILAVDISAIPGYCFVKAELTITATKAQTGALEKYQTARKAVDKLAEKANKSGKTMYSIMGAKPDASAAGNRRFFDCHNLVLADQQGKTYPAQWLIGYAGNLITDAGEIRFAENNLNGWSYTWAASGLFIGLVEKDKPLKCAFLFSVPKTSDLSALKVRFDEGSQKDAGSANTYDAGAATSASTNKQPSPIDSGKTSGKHWGIARKCPVGKDDSANAEKRIRLFPAEDKLIRIKGENTSPIPFDVELIDPEKRDPFYAHAAYVFIESGTQTAKGRIFLSGIEYKWPDGKNRMTIGLSPPPTEFPRAYKDLKGTMQCYFSLQTEFMGGKRISDYVRVPLEYTTYAQSAE